MLSMDEAKGGEPIIAEAAMMDLADIVPEKKKETVLATTAVASKKPSFVTVLQG